MSETASRPRAEIDPMTLRVLGGAFGSIAKEMAQVIFRTAFFQIIREAEDLGAGLFTADGQEIAESETTAMHCGSIGSYLRGIIEIHGDDIHDGDVFLHNDPFHGASHMADVCIAIPIFWDGRLVAWAADTAHLADLGSASAGLCTDAFDTYAEGRNYQALKIEARGVPNEELMRHVFGNVRTPELNRGDIEALYTASQLGARRFRGLLEKYGADVVLGAAHAWMDHCERLLRAEIAKVPDGDYAAPVQWMDDDAKHRDHPLNVNVTVRKRGSDITVDLTGSHPEVETAVNSPLEGSTKIAAYFIIRTIFLDQATHDAFIPNNEGMFRPVHVEAPEGSLFNPRFPRATYARFCACQIAADSVLLALADALPEQVCAGTGAEVHVIAFSGIDEASRRYWVYVQVNESSWGGRFGKDGMDSIGCLMENIRNNPIEEEEMSFPVRVERYELRDEGPAPGRWRGGLGVVRATRFLGEGWVTSEAERQLDRPKGIFGGHDGRTASTTVTRADGSEVSLPSKFTTFKLEPGDRIEFRTACGGGYGPALERDPQLVARDVRDELLTAADARRDYGVVLDPATLELDAAATARERAAAGAVLG
ncbi:hydantoinase B/oxoprolinase family protein [Capillimicrobium parvum]|uniref:Acetophenone carboxylase delta subunit n=1 Tax=Capillimicrobium parvum TaxID=2884022 RepID=A0A9E7C1F3_9ACTN|nr:hydantoinase B/oxoprolinase family protein [Capillimicrobium parvum]UGS37336.1 Acetophenone carboxylase delta subunit [Capillimicrobium parvum]